MTATTEPSVGSRARAGREGASRPSRRGRGPPAVDAGGLVILPRPRSDPRQPLSMESANLGSIRSGAVDVHLPDVRFSSRASACSPSQLSVNRSVGEKPQPSRPSVVSPAISKSWLAPVGKMVVGGYLDRDRGAGRPAVRPRAGSGDPRPARGPAAGGVRRPAPSAGPAAGGVWRPAPSAEAPTEPRGDRLGRVLGPPGSSAVSAVASGSKSDADDSRWLAAWS
jgi:hypothetical protein